MVWQTFSVSSFSMVYVAIEIEFKEVVWEATYIQRIYSVSYSLGTVYYTGF